MPIQCTREPGHRGKHRNDHHGRQWRTPWVPVSDIDGMIWFTRAPNQQAWVDWCRWAGRDPASNPFTGVPG